MADVLSMETCIVCGETIWWNGQPHPACFKHTYGEVMKAVDARKAKRKKVKR